MGDARQPSVGGQVRDSPRLCQATASGDIWLHDAYIASVHQVEELVPSHAVLTRSGSDCRAGRYPCKPDEIVWWEKLFKPVWMEWFDRTREIEHTGSIPTQVKIRTRVEA